MAKTVELKIPDDIEYRVIGNAFGLLIVSAGLLAGEMVHMRSFDYWFDDIVPLLLLLWFCFRLYTNFLLTVTVASHQSHAAAEQREHYIRESLKSEPAAVAQIAAKTGYTAEQVVEEVAKRIEAKKAESAKKLLES